MLHKSDLKLQLKAKPKIRKGSRSSVSSFIAKTYEILEDGHFPDIVSWNSEGTAIIIKSPSEFAQKVLPIYFKHRNLTSFVRQLNMYNFRKQRTHKVEHVYCHELFQRDKKYLLEQIKRKNQEQFLLDPQEVVEEVEPIDINLNMTTLIQEKWALKRFNSQASNKINCLEGKVKDLTVQNQMLRDQLWQQSERDKILISLMANILKKYDIPPTELSYIMKGNETKEHSFKQLMHDDMSFIPSKNEGDISKFLNLDSGHDVTQATSIVLNNKSYEEKSSNRDISPSCFARTDLRWDSISPRKPMLGDKNRYPNFFQNESMCTTANLGFRGRFQGQVETNLKRMYEEQQDTDSLSDETFEPVMKRVEFNPSIMKINESYANSDIYNQIWIQNTDIPEHFNAGFLTFKN